MVSNQVFDTIVMGETALLICYTSIKEKSKHFDFTAIFDTQQLNSSDALLPFVVLALQWNQLWVLHWQA